MKRELVFTLCLVAIAIGSLFLLFFLMNGCALRNPVPCDPSPDCVCGPCGIVETVTKDAGEDAAHP